MKKILLIIALTLISTSANADYVVYGEGNTSCPDIIKTSKGTTISEQIQFTTDSIWVAGYVTAVGEKSHVRIIDQETKMDWILDFCEHNLDANLAIAAHALVTELKK